MKLEYIRQTIDSPKIEDSRFTYEDSFPEEERPPFEMLLSFDNAKFYGVYEEGKYVGLIDMIETDDLAYLFFLAIEKTKRGQGYGTKILSDLKQRYQDKRLFLLAEEIGEQYENNEDRKRRLAFYSSNGFNPIGIKILEFGVMYDLLTCGSKVSKDDFLRVMASAIGEERVRYFYKDC